LCFDEDPHIQVTEMINKFQTWLNPKKKIKSTKIEGIDGNANQLNG